jgi:7-cyano-7-deazaguanine synthase in queuosine biosynthesis
VTKPMSQPHCPSLRLQIVEKDGATRDGWQNCEIGRHIRFSTSGLESYFFEQWHPVVFDLLLVAAAVEFCDRRLPRPAHGWARRFEVCIPVHDPQRWSAAGVSRPLHDALSLLTGDSWSIAFTARNGDHPEVRQTSLPLSNRAQAVIAFSKGLDSRAVAGLVAAEMGNGLVRIRLGREPRDKLAGKRERAPFTSIPYRVGGSGSMRLPETSARSRGFKFAVISLASAYLAKVRRIIVPESGQGALGPVLVPVGHAYADYRNYPQFTNLMEVFGAQLLETVIGYEFPRLWYTKGETLAAYQAIAPQSTVWSKTWSCWQQSRQSSVSGKKRQCGICAACMLRRMSVHAAGLEEDPSRYVWERLSSATLNDGVADGFERRRIGKAMREYALAGTLHLQHLAELNQAGAKKRGLDRIARQVGRLTGLTAQESEAKATRLIDQHEKEWTAFTTSLGSDSFVMNWARGE